MERFAKKEFYTVVIGGFLLSNTAGFINAVSLAGLLSAPVSHVTGSVTKIALSMLKGDVKWMGVYTSMVCSFMLGAMVSGYMIGTSKFQLGRKYGMALLLESGALTLGCILLNFEWTMGESVLAFACGLQNAMASSYSGAVLRTTHMTGITTDIGIILGQLVARTSQVEVWKLKVFIPLLFGYVTGGVLGGVFFDLIGIRSLMIPATMLFACALFYLTWEPAKEAREALQFAMKKIQNEVELGVRRVTIPIVDLAKTGAANLITKPLHSFSNREVSIQIPTVIYPESKFQTVPIEVQIQEFMQAIEAERMATTQKKSQATKVAVEKSMGEGAPESEENLLSSTSEPLIPIHSTVNVSTEKQDQRQTDQYK
ncbi:hypothetical protein HMI54_014253 [Coelomomyces lativittatus]|nr:hypothetical protein HMI56_003886 [Coelomomyces lativittatus]KAJ1514380.1 hypothetical protein HMI54_014253 [Coelomomyces lativittatus]KAJ1514929.1 hypothetical protein HMI55_004206 [Coelomomyces lativittatus]